MAASSSFCPGGRPHYWILDPQNKGKCQYCQEERQFEGHPVRSQYVAVAAKPKLPYRKAYDYEILQPLILMRWVEVNHNIARTSEAFDPPIPRTTLRKLIKKWNPSRAGKLQKARLDLPGVVVTGEVGIVTAVTRSVKSGQIQIRATKGAHEG
jgi:hypothetical protein